ncbi:protein-tyrosine phosphatase [Exophiala viscosa]|uniref:protein-tyrosine phosphatase n=1 Tax=Exophiala viscosa TaxID=2486360 RepID=UPI00219A7ED4|nr:protein-tyrosine phosphatase [Exophiala viscosa]
MPQSLAISNTPSSSSIKRQRSQELPVSGSRPPSSGQTPPNAAIAEGDLSGRGMSVKIPPYLDKNRAKISAAFQDLEWKQRFRLQHAFHHPESPFRVDRSHTVISRNRYGNVQPWDSARVKLKKPIGGSDYVNASPIKLTSHGSKPKQRSVVAPTSSADQIATDSEIEYRYVATQGPKEGQFSHFWHMVMQESDEVGVVIMLTQLYEGNKEKCAQYFPADMDNPTIVLPAHEEENEDEGDLTDDGDPFLDSPKSSADTDSLGTDTESDTPHSEQAATDGVQRQCGTVSLLSLTYDASTGCEVRILELKIEDEIKLIHHYLFNHWPDFGKPEAEDRRALIELTKVSKAVAGDSPRIVHCSAGVGRTGTWIAMDYLLSELEAERLVEAPSYMSLSKATSSTSVNRSGTWGKSGPPKPSTPETREEDDLIWETVNSLREQRMMMVMNELQFSFLYEVLRDAFMDKYAQKETGPVVKDVQEPSPKVARKESSQRGMYESVQNEEAEEDEDAMDDAASNSEAETEIMEKDKGEQADSSGKAAEPEVEDSYAVVAPAAIREGQMKQEQNEVRDHEVK